MPRCNTRGQYGLSSAVSCRAYARSQYLRHYTRLYQLIRMRVTLFTQSCYHPPHAEHTSVEVEGALGVLDAHHGLLHDEVLAALVRLRQKGLVVLARERLLFCHRFSVLPSNSRALQYRDAFSTRPRTELVCAGSSPRGLETINRNPLHRTQHSRILVADTHE